MSDRGSLTADLFDDLMITYVYKVVRKKATTAIRRKHGGTAHGGTPSCYFVPSSSLCGIKFNTPPWAVPLCFRRIAVVAFLCKT